VAKGVKATHKTGARFEDSINDVLQYLAPTIQSEEAFTDDSAGQFEEPQPAA